MVAIGVMPKGAAGVIAPRVAAIGREPVIARHAGRAIRAEWAVTGTIRTCLPPIAGAFWPDRAIAGTLRACVAIGGVARFLMMVTAVLPRLAWTLWLLVRPTSPRFPRLFLAVLAEIALGAEAPHTALLLLVWRLLRPGTAIIAAGWTIRPGATVIMPGRPAGTLLRALEALVWPGWPAGTLVRAPEALATRSGTAVPGERRAPIARVRRRGHEPGRPALLLARTGAITLGADVVRAAPGGVLFGQIHMNRLEERFLLTR